MQSEALRLRIRRPSTTPLSLFVTASSSKARRSARRLLREARKAFYQERLFQLGHAGRRDSQERPATKAGRALLTCSAGSLRGENDPESVCRISNVRIVAVPVCGPYITRVIPPGPRPNDMRHAVGLDPGCTVRRCALIVLVSAILCAI